MERVCSIRGSARSERTRDKNNPYVLTKEESINAINVEKDPQKYKRVCSKQLEKGEFRILAE